MRLGFRVPWSSRFRAPSSSLLVGPGAAESAPAVSAGVAATASTGSTFPVAAALSASVLALISLVREQLKPVEFLSHVAMIHGDSPTPSGLVVEHQCAGAKMWLGQQRADESQSAQLANCCGGPAGAERTPACSLWHGLWQLEAAPSHARPPLAAPPAAYLVSQHQHRAADWTSAPQLFRHVSRCGRLSAVWLQVASILHKCSSHHLYPPPS